MVNAVASQPVGKEGDAPCKIQVTGNCMAFGKVLVVVIVVVVVVVVVVVTVVVTTGVVPVPNPSSISRIQRCVLSPISFRMTTLPYA